MASDSSDPKAPKPDGWQSLLAHTRGLIQSLHSNDNADHTPSATPPPADIPMALPVTEPIEGEIPTALPVTAEDEEKLLRAVPIPAEATAVPPPTPPPVPTAPAVCPLCQCPRAANQLYCTDCGFYFPDESSSDPAPSASVLPFRLRDRYEFGAQLSERQGVARFRARDLNHPLGEAVSVIIVRQAIPRPSETPPEDERGHETPPEDEEVLPGFDLPSGPVIAPTAVLRSQPLWPELAWEKNLLGALEHPVLPTILDNFVEGDWEYLIEEVPTGRSLWDAWDDPATSNRERFGWLAQVAEALQMLHRMRVMLEGIRPDIIVIDRNGQPRLTDLTDLLPMPLPPGTPLHGRLYSAPELFTSPDRVDARAELYSFGAMLYALHVGREVSDVDFDRPGHPKPFIPRFPDVHPAFGRLLSKTFRREVHSRFPTDEAATEDPSGFTELIHALRSCGRAMDTVRLEIAAWTTTGMVRTGNEDAFALLHACESRQDDLSECALVLLADGMGGYEAGEVAAALAIQSLREFLTQQKPFKVLAGGSSFTARVPGSSEGNAINVLEVEQCKQLLRNALKESNRQVFAASRSGVGKRGMGCTAEVVYIDGQNVVVGHVGDSRTYHLHEGRMIQLTRDQTLVNRLVELGTLTAEEAETHPRRNELQQAIGGQPDVNPDVYHGELKPGDWVVVCSDGLSNHVNSLMLKQMLEGEAASAEMAARRLVNLANIEGATDNATVVVVRAT